MSMFTLAISCLTTSSLPWFMDLTSQVPMQYCSLQHRTLLPSPVTSTTGRCFRFGSISSFFLELFLHSSPVAYWGPTDLGVHLSVSYLFAFLIFHTSKSGFNSIRTENFQMFKVDLEKAEESEIKLPTSAGSLKKQESSRKTSTFTLLTMPKPLTVWTTTNCGKFWKRWEQQTTLTASWEICMQAKKQ